MIRNLILRLLRGRHYWRRAPFDEVSELYISRMMTVFAINVVTLFIAVYLYELGYSLVFIAFLYAALYAMKVVLSPLAGRYVAYWGPRRAIFVANIMRVPSLLILLGVEQYGLWAVVVFGIIQQASACLYDLAYLVNFSRVKQVKHAGKQIGTMQILEKVARVISPIVGGALATIYSPQITILIAAVVFSLAAWPLFMSAESIPSRYKLEMHRVKLRSIWRISLGQVVVGFDFVANGMAWTLFLAAVVFAGSDDKIYAIVGLLASIGVVASAVGAYAFGHMIDRRRGTELLTSTVILKSIIHMFRPVSVAPAGAVANGLSAEMITTGYAMAFMRAMFDRADDSPSRIVFMTYMEMVVNTGAAVACLVFGLALFVADITLGFASVFIVAALVQLLLLFSRRYA